VLRHTIELCHALGLTVTAEGIETAAQESLLRSLNCDFGQGFHYARPTGSPDTVIARARRHRPT
jgi:EAL domain-containing protein (putative c-di-GMP-specific phosphodiesterase class I)